MSFGRLFAGMTAEIGETYVHCLISHSVSSSRHSSALPLSHTPSRLRAIYRADCQTTLSLLPALAGSLLPPLREAERRIGASLLQGTSCEGARLPCDRQARLPALHRGDFGHRHRASSPDRRTISSRYPGSACALLFIQASPSHSRRPPHRGRTVTTPPGTRLRTPPAGAAIPAPPTERLRKAPSVNGDGVYIA
jgi:hypothetical protein